MLMVFWKVISWPKRLNKSVVFRRIQNINLVNFVLGFTFFFLFELILTPVIMIKINKYCFSLDNNRLGMRKDSNLSSTFFLVFRSFFSSENDISHPASIHYMNSNKIKSFTLRMLITIE